MIVFFVFLLCMDIQAEKYHLIQQIVNLQDSLTITKIKELLNAKRSDDWYDDLTVSQKKAINKSIAQADAGNTVPHEVVRKQIREKIQRLKNS